VRRPERGPDGDGIEAQVASRERDS